MSWGRGAGYVFAKIRGDVERVVQIFAEKNRVKPVDVRSLALAIGVAMLAEYAKEGRLEEALKNVDDYILAVTASILFDIDIDETGRLVEAVKKLLQSRSM